jgi:hypothetical protein
MNPLLTTDGGSENTATHIASQQCVGAAGVGAGASCKGKGIIAGAVGLALLDCPAGQWLAGFLWFLKTC